MQDNPNEQGKPRFLARDDAAPSPEGPYKGRFLHKDEPEAEDAAEAPAFQTDALDIPLTFEEAPGEDSQEAAADPEDAAEAPAFQTDALDIPLSFEETPGEDSQEAAAEPEDASYGEAPTDTGFDGLHEPPDPDYTADISEDLPEEPEEVLPETVDDYSEIPDDAPVEDVPLTEEDADFQELFSAEPEAEDEIPVRDHPAPKGRPKRRKGEGLLGIPNILVTLVWIAIILAIGVTLGRMIWVCAADVLAFGREDHKVTITISSTDDIDDIAQKLKSANLIRYPGLFKLYASFAVDEGEIQPGIWDLNTLYDYHALVNMMSPSSHRSVVTIMIPEGSSCRQIFELLQEKRVCTVEALESYAATGDLGDHWFLDGLTRGDKYCLEGYLFPDTYEFYTNDTAENVLNKMLNNFDSRVDESIRGQLDSLNGYLVQLMTNNGRDSEYISSHMLSMANVITVASLIEKESASAEESYTIASVIYNRLYAWGSTPAYLNIDAAVIYGLDGKTDLTQADLQTDTPYNTYLHTGLTPGPITNPGLNSIKAALAPQNTKYYYYILDPAVGTHHFSSTLEEHEAFREAIRG